MFGEFIIQIVRRCHGGKGGEIQKGSRIDYALVSAGLDQKVKHATYLAGIKTDHRGFYMVVELQPSNRGVGYWKFNNTLLTNREYIERMKQELMKHEKVQRSTAGENWESIKTKIKKVVSGLQ